MDEDMLKMVPRPLLHLIQSTYSKKKSVPPYKEVVEYLMASNAQSLRSTPLSLRSIVIKGLICDSVLNQARSLHTSLGCTFFGAIFRV